VYQGLTVIITTHNPNQAIELGAKVGMLHGQDRPFSVIESSALSEEALSELYDIGVKIVRAEGLARDICVTGI
ncbi:MAG: hypothetical protein LBH64_00700, partial [Coriobacteriales bacterium]|nr:hypothetical protein [Coriobacteriales bacterium]